MLGFGFMVAILRLLMILAVVGVVGYVIYCLVKKSDTLKKHFPEGRPVIDRARDMITEVKQEKNVIAAAKAKLNQNKEELEEMFPENRGKKKRGKK